MKNVQWKKVKLGDCLTIGNGCDYKHLKEGDIPVFGTGGIMAHVDGYLYDGETVCIGRKGTINHPIYHNGKIWTVDTLFYTHSFIDVIPKFVYYAFCNIDWNKYNEATGVPSLSKETIYKIEISVPSLSAQRRIAAILSAADKVIEQTRQLIGKYKSIKQGMMEDLLKPKEGWKKVKLGDCCIRLCNGMTYDIEERTGHLVTRIETISEGYIDYSKVGHTNYMPKQEYKLVKGDILFSHINSIKHIGKVAYYDDEIELYHGMNLLVIRTDNKIDSKYLFYQLTSENVRKEIRALAKSAVNQASINTTELQKFEINFPFKNDVPDLPEQRRIAKILSGIDRKIEAEGKVLEKYEMMKKGLMERMLEDE